MKVRNPPQGKRKEDSGGNHDNGDDPERQRQERSHEVRPECLQEWHREALHERDLLHERPHEARRDPLHEGHPIRRRERPQDGRRERLHVETRCMWGAQFAVESVCTVVVGKRLHDTHCLEDVQTYVEACGTKDVQV